eukprot:TRINITY_DN60310_c0_g1_i1.p1 TRINITY_DN60310_c0_g1~~TRINITY_DN60310_c0_g1_i1.p1  ORF type:complete len:318 (-),score=65.91 TRINITY_DN60310_c0_g1_i1:28-867(-)
MEVFKKIDKHLCVWITVTDTQSGIHRKYELVEENVNAKPSKCHIWTIEFDMREYPLLKRKSKACNEEELQIHSHPVSTITGPSPEADLVSEISPPSESLSQELTVTPTPPTHAQEVASTPQTVTEEIITVPEETKNVDGDHLGNRWSESVIADITSNVLITEISAVIEILKDNLDMTHSPHFEPFSQKVIELANKCKSKQKAQAAYCENMKVVSDSSSMFAYFHCKKEKDGVISLAYAIHILKFKNEMKDLSLFLKEKDKYQKQTAFKHLLELGVNPLC